MNEEQAKPTLGAKLWRAGSLICALLSAAAVPFAVQDRKWDDVALLGGVSAMFCYWWFTWHKKKPNGPQ